MFKVCLKGPMLILYCMCIMIVEGLKCQCQFLLEDFGSKAAVVDSLRAKQKVYNCWQIRYGNFVARNRIPEKMGFLRGNAECPYVNILRFRTIYT